MKKWIVVLSVTLIIAVGVIFINQRQVNAIVRQEVAIIHCEVVAGNTIRVKGVDSTVTSPSIGANTSCAEALAKLMESGFKIQTPLSDTSAAFNYTLIK